MTYNCTQLQKLWDLATNGHTWIDKSHHTGEILLLLEFADTIYH